MKVAVPAYLDSFLDAVAAGAPFDSIHLGHWDEPRGIGAVMSTAFAAAQDRLTSILLAMLDVQPSHRALDVACGLGGALRRLRRLSPDADLHGLNVDPRQIAICRKARSVGGSPLSWVVADAARLPYADATFDRVLCIEAQFHFASRRSFFEEAHRVLRDGGVLVASDILLQPPENDATRRRIETILDRDFAPWPEKWLSIDDVVRAAGDCGLRCERRVDATENTFPSYAFIAPHDRVAPGVVAMRELHARGDLRYAYLKFIRRDGDRKAAAAVPERRQEK